MIWNEAIKQWGAGINPDFEMIMLYVLTDSESSSLSYIEESN